MGQGKHLSKVVGTSDRVSGHVGVKRGFLVQFGLLDGRQPGKKEGLSFSRSTWKQKECGRMRVGSADLCARIIP